MGHNRKGVRTGVLEISFAFFCFLHQEEKMPEISSISQVHKVTGLGKTFPLIKNFLQSTWGLGACKTPWPSMLHFYLKEKMKKHNNIHRYDQILTSLVGYLS